MTRRDVPFLEDLREELRRAAQNSTGRAGRGLRPARLWRFNAVRVLVPALAVVAALAYVVLGLGSGSPHRLPVNDFSAGTSYQLSPSTKFVGNATCIRMLRDRHLPPLVRSNAAPDQALMSELATLREPPAAPVDSTTLGRWDRFPLYISTVFQRYVRVFYGPRNVKLAFVPVVYCNQTVPNGAPRLRASTVRETREEGLVMLVLSNPGDHPPVLVGTAQQIKQGPAIAGLDTSHQPGWIQAIVVPDGITHVVMKFTPPFLHRYSNTVTIQSNVGIVVRNPPYEPTTVLWYGTSGKLVKKFVDHKTIAMDKCLAAHRKSCFGPVPKPAPGTLNPPLTAPAEPAANALYQPLIAYARATTAVQRAKARAAASHVGSLNNRCDAPYSKQLFSNLNMASKSKATQHRAATYLLWNRVSGMETQEADVAPVAPQLKQLAAAWAGLSLKNKQINDFAHGMATELTTTLNAPPITTCGFVHALAAHHFSYTWARQSAYWSEATTWWHRIVAASNGTNSFWKYVNKPIAGGSGGVGQNLFTQAQLAAISNLPGAQG